MTTPPAPGRARTVVLTILLAALAAFPPMAVDQYLPAFPEIRAALGASAAGMQWTLSVFFIGFAAGQLIFGPLSDRFGRLPPLMVGVVAFILASAACAVSSSIEALIFWRGVEGLGAAAGSVIGRAMIRDLYDGTKAASMLSLMALVMGIAPMVAPILGAGVTAWFGWAANFQTLALFGAVCMVGAIAGLRETLPLERRRPAAPRAILAAYATLARDRRFVAYALSSGFSFGGYFAYISGSPFAFMELNQVSPTVYSYLFGLNVLGMMALASLNSRLVGRFGIDVMLRQGLRLGAAGGVAFLLLALGGIQGLYGVAAALFLFVSAQGMITPNAMAGALSIRPEMAGTASALAGTGMFVIGAVAGAMVGLLFDGSLRPMAAIIAAAALGALWVGRGAAARRVVPA